MVPRLFQLRSEGKIAAMRIATECACVPNCLKYNPQVRDDGAGDPAFPPLSAAAREER